MMMIIIMHRSIRNFNLHPRAIEPLKIGWIKPPPPPHQSKDDGEMRAARGLHGKILKL